MSIYHRRNIQRQEPDLRGLESRLQSAFQPVNPRPEFVRDLSYHLKQPDFSFEELYGEGGWRFLVIAGASLLSGTFILFVLVRWILAQIENMHQLKDEPESISPAGQMI